MVISNYPMLNYRKSEVSWQLALHFMGPSLSAGAETYFSVRRVRLPRTHNG